MKEVFPGVYKEGKRLFTKSLTPGIKVYGERLLRFRGEEYREWNPRRSKLAAAILKGLKTMPIKPGSHILYLGAAQGTTVSHVSDIVGPKGLVIAVEFSPKAMKDLLIVAETRENIIPVLADANKPEEYKDYLLDIDVVYQDVAQPNQSEILLKNVQYAKPKYTMLCVKSRSIDVVKDPRQVFKEVLKELEGAGLETMEVVNLAPYEADHAMIVSKVSK